MTNEPEPDSLDAYTVFAPVAFIEGIRSAPSDESAYEMAVKFGRNLSSLNALRHVTVAVDEVLKAESDRLWVERLRTASKTMTNAYLEAHATIELHGLVLHWKVEAETLAVLGHALDEGVTEIKTRRIVESGQFDNIITVTLRDDPDRKDEHSDSPKEDRDERKKTTRYEIEVEFVNRLANLVGENILLEAYFSGEHYQRLVEAVDTKIGDGGFIRLLQLSDEGKWLEAFALLKEATA
jgi:hypothetical protein